MNRAWPWVIAGVVTGCVAQPAPRTTVLALVDADNRGDLDAAVACYTDDVVWVPPNADRVLGIAAIRERYRDMFARYRPELTIEIAGEIRDNASSARVHGATRGRLHPRVGGAPTVVDDVFTAELRLVDGRWRVAQLAWRPRASAGASIPR